MPRDSDVANRPDLKEHGAEMEDYMLINSGHGEYTGQRFSLLKTNFS